MARLIFCFFAEDTGIFIGDDCFTACVRQMTASDGSNVHEVLEELFRAMDVHPDDRRAAALKPYADVFPYVNGGLFEGSRDCPRFSRIARSYLIRAGELDWREINPDIFGSMIQAVADEGERGALGLHYTSVPNIMKVLGPLFLDDLHAQLEAAGTNARKLLNLRKRLSRIRVFDPACGSGNFLVIAYIRMREIEALVCERRGEALERSWVPLSNFHGIEIKDFAAEIAKLALLIAEFQCDVRMIGQAEARALILPLKDTGRIVTGNALRLDWLEVCPPAGGTDDERLALDDPEAVETYVCGNPPYVGSKRQTAEQRADLKAIFAGRAKTYKTLDYVAGWFLKAASFLDEQRGTAAFVATNSVCQGEQAGTLWPVIFALGHHIRFAHRSFKWANLAAHNAGVTCVIVGISGDEGTSRWLFDHEQSREVASIGPYLLAMDETVVTKRRDNLSGLPAMQFGNHPYYATDLMFSRSNAEAMIRENERLRDVIRPLYGSKEFVDGAPRFCLWLTDDDLPWAMRDERVAARVEGVRIKRLDATNDRAAQQLADSPHRFRDQTTAERHTLIVPRVSSENRPYLPVGVFDKRAVLQDRAFALYDAPLWNLALIASRLHWVWIGTVCVRMRTDFSYSNTLGWNTFPVPRLTAEHRAELTERAEAILLAREAHFPATIAELYDPAAMPADLRAAHEANDEALERIYIGRRFRNDTERLEHLFERYTKMIEAERRREERERDEEKARKAGARKAKAAERKAANPRGRHERFLT